MSSFGEPCEVIIISMIQHVYVQSNNTAQTIAIHDIVKFNTTEHMYNEEHKQKRGDNMFKHHTN